jgi:hypothetical protein
MPLVSYFIHKQVEKVSIYKLAIIKLIQTLINIVIQNIKERQIFY